jgi:hypothetical protein
MPRSISNKYCHCVACIRFIGWYDWRFGRYGECGICCRENTLLYNRDAVPEVLKKFFKSSNVCWGCINVMNAEFYRLGVCWGNSSDEMIRWGFAAVALYRFRCHISWANNNRHGETVKTLECCKKGRHRYANNRRVID